MLERREQHYWTYTLHDHVQTGVRLVHGWVQMGHGKLGGVPQLVAEMPVADHAVDVQVDVTALSGVCQQAEAKGIGATLWDSVREIELLALDGGSDLGKRKWQSQQQQTR